VGDRGDGGQASQRDVVEVAPATRCPRSSEIKALCLSRRSVELPRIALSSKTNGRKDQELKDLEL